MRRTARHFYVVLLFFCVPISADALLAQDASSSPGPAETVVNLIHAVHQGDGELVRDLYVTRRDYGYPNLLAYEEGDIEILLETVFENGVAHSAYAFNNRMGVDVERGNGESKWRGTWVDVSRIWCSWPRWR